MVHHILHGFVHHFGIIYDRSYSYFLDKLVPPLSFAVGPVIDIQERVPAEQEIRIGLLLQIWLKRVCIEFLVIADAYLIFCQAVFAILQYTCGAAGCCQNCCRDGGKYYRSFFHLS